ncbi:hypothetical protein PUN28_019337 [Cardiocondyla obscurior]|uniref:Uncharacterized protein n=1 Tax=Cardiocondyla obscurior TaxID=286306 RepID=A0AAW2ECB5_9HYME
MALLFNGQLIEYGIGKGSARGCEGLRGEMDLFVYYWIAKSDARPKSKNSTDADIKTLWQSENGESNIVIVIVVVEITVLKTRGEQYGFVDNTLALKEGPTRHSADILRKGGGPGRVSCIGGATFSHRQIFITPLDLMQIEYLINNSAAVHQ